MVRKTTFGNNVSTYEVGLLVGAGYAFRWNCRDYGVILRFPIWCYVVCWARSVREDSITKQKNNNSLYMKLYINEKKTYVCGEKIGLGNLVVRRLLYSKETTGSRMVQYNK